MEREREGQKSQERFSRATLTDISVLMGNLARGDGFTEDLKIEKQYLESFNCVDDKKQCEIPACNNNIEVQEVFCRFVINYYKTYSESQYLLISERKNVIFPNFFSGITNSNR